MSYLVKHWEANSPEGKCGGSKCPGGGGGEGGK